MLGQLQLNVDHQVPGLEVGQHRTRPEPATAKGGGASYWASRLLVTFAQFGFHRFGSEQQSAGALAQRFTTLQWG